MGQAKRAFLWVLKNTLNRATIRLARSGRGPFSLIRHVGRRTGRRYETPVLLATVREGFVAELTYGPDVAWFRNIVAADSFEVLVKGRALTIDRIEPCEREAGLRAFGSPAAWVLRLLRRREFRLFHAADGEARVSSTPERG